MKVFLIMSILQVILYLIIAFILWDIDWVLNLDDLKTQDRFFMIVLWIATQIPITGIVFEMARK